MIVGSASSFADSVGALSCCLVSGRIMFPTLIGVQCSVIDR